MLKKTLNQFKLYGAKVLCRLSRKKENIKWQNTREKSGAVAIVIRISNPSCYSEMELQ